MKKIRPRHEPEVRRKIGAPTLYKAEYANIAERMCLLGATNKDLAAAFNVRLSTIDDWAAKHPLFAGALKLGKGQADVRVSRSLYQRAVGYHYDAVKIFLPAGAKAPVIVPYAEHVPPDTTAAIFWLKNRDPAHWRDAWQIEASVGKYIISDKPMTAQQWIEQRALLIESEAEDVTPKPKNKNDELGDA